MWELEYNEIQPVHLKEISPEYSLKGLKLKLKHQYFGHLMRRADSFEKTLMLGKIEVGGEGHDRGWDGWMASPTQWTWVWVNSRSWWWTGRPGVLQSIGSHRVKTRLSDWTDVNEATLNWAVQNMHVHVLQPCLYLTSDRACDLFPRDGLWWSVTRKTLRPLRTQKEQSRCPTQWTACRAFSAWSLYSCWPSTWLCWEVMM